MVDILELIRARQLKSIKASISYGEILDSRVSQQAAEVKEVLAGEKDGTGDKLLGDNLAAFYYQMLDSYTGNPAIRVPTSSKKRGLALWKRVGEACDKSQVEPKLFMKAQFEYFHKCFGKSPKVHQLATEGAIERAKLYTGCVIGNVVGNDIRHKGSLAGTMRFAEKQMREIQEAQGMTREEVYKNLVITGMILFPKEYLEADPIYQKLVMVHG